MAMEERGLMISLVAERVLQAVIALAISFLKTLLYHYSETDTSLLPIPTLLLVSL